MRLHDYPTCIGAHFYPHSYFARQSDCFFGRSFINGGLEISSIQIFDHVRTLSLLANIKENIELKSLYFQLLVSDTDEVRKIRLELDSVFVDFSFFPALNWNEYRQFIFDYNVLNAWRHPAKELFAFLLSPTKTSRGNNDIELIINIIGPEIDLSRFREKILKLKQVLRKEALQKYDIKTASSRIDIMPPKRSIGVLITAFSALMFFAVLYSNISIFISKNSHFSFVENVLSVIGLIILTVVLTSILIGIIVTFNFIIKTARDLVKR